MKKTYIIPEVSTYNVTKHHILTVSIGVGSDITTPQGGDVNSNYYDDHDPWYRR